MLRRIAWASACFVSVLGMNGADAQQLPDLVTTDVFRVCADPANLPFSDRKEAGFENKIAAIIADELKVPLRSYWLPQGPGFVRNTLGQGFCDAIIGSAAGVDLVQNTNPYYRSTYVLVKRKGELADLVKLDDPRLKDKAVGVIARSPPSDRFVELGLIEKAKSYSPYSLSPDRQYQTPTAEAIADVAAHRTDAAVVWGPAAGWLARHSGADLEVVPLLQEPDRPQMSFRIAIGVRINENEWKRSLNTVLRKRRDDIQKVLLDYGVPLLEEEGNTLIKPATSGSR